MSGQIDESEDRYEYFYLIRYEFAMFTAYCLVMKMDSHIKIVLVGNGRLAPNTRVIQLVLEYLLAREIFDITSADIFIVDLPITEPNMLRRQLNLILEVAPRVVYYRVPPPS